MKPDKQTPLAQLWTKRVHRWQQSGLTQTEWSRTNHINYHHQGYWKRKLLKPTVEKNSFLSWSQNP